MGVEKLLPPESWTHEPIHKTKNELLQARRAENLRLAVTFERNDVSKSNGRRYIMSGEMHPRPTQNSGKTGHTDHIVFDDGWNDQTPTKTRSSLKQTRRQKDLHVLQHTYQGESMNNQRNPPRIEKKKKKMSKADKEAQAKARAGRTRSDIMHERAQERIKINEVYQAVLHEDQNTNNIQVEPTWWKQEPGYVDDPSNMIAESNRIKKSHARELKFDGSKARTVTLQELVEKHEKKSNFPEKITNVPFRPSTAGPRVPHNVKWTDAIIHFSKDGVNKEDTVLMEKYDLKFKAPLDSSFTKDMLFREDRIKGLPRKTPNVQKDPFAIDKSNKATNKLFAMSTAKRQELDTMKSERGIGPPRVERKHPIHQSYQRDFQHGVASGMELHSVRDDKPVRSSGFANLDLDRLLLLNPNTPSVIARKHERDEKLT